MANRVVYTAGDKAGELDAKAALQREVIPVVREIRRRFNELVDELPDDYAAKIDAVTGLEASVSDLEASVSDLEALHESVREDFCMSGGNFGSSSFTPMTDTDFSGTGANGITCLFDPSIYPETRGSLTRAVYLEVVLVVGTVSGGTQEFRLYNVSDGEAVTGTVQAHSSTTVATYKLGPLTVGTGAGEIKDSQKLYRCEGRDSSALYKMVTVKCSFFVTWE